MIFVRGRRIAGRCFAAVLAIGAIDLWWVGASAAERANIPVPTSVVYAGEVITAEKLRPRSVPQSYLDRSAVYRSTSEVIGMVPKVTLPPGRPIPIGYLVEPEVIKVNTPVMMFYRQGMLVIQAEVMPLASAREGELVRARNMQTGVVVLGTATREGTLIARTSQ